MTNSGYQGARLHSLIDALNTNPKRFAEAINLSPSFIYQVLSGQKSISARVILNITSAYSQVNINWLLTGEGDMFDDKKEPAGVNEPGEKYRPAERREAPLAGLQDIIDDFERRIKYLEERDKARSD